MAIIEIRIRSLAQLFDSLDPSPFHQRGLNRDAASYIVDCAAEHAPNEPLRLLIHVPDRVRPHVADATQAIRSHFRFAGDANMRIAPTRLAHRATRTFAVDVETAEVGHTVVDDQKLAVVAPMDGEWLAPRPGPTPTLHYAVMVEPRHCRSLQSIPRAGRIFYPQLRGDARPTGFPEGVDELRSDIIIGKDVALNSNGRLRTCYILQHRVVQSVTFDKHRDGFRRPALRLSVGVGFAQWH